MSQSSFDSTGLPALAAHTHCVLIPRDPNFIYAYWDYTQQDIHRARGELKAKSRDVRLVLRIYDVTHRDFNPSRAHYTWDIDVGFSVKNWYIHVCRDNADYCAQLGLVSGGNFIPLQRSNIVRTPPNFSSSRDDLIWQDIKANQESLPYIEAEIKSSKKKTAKGKPSKRARLYYLTDQDIRDYYRNLFARMSKKGRRKYHAQALSMEEILKGRFKGTSWQKTRPILTLPDLIKRCHPGSSMEFQGASFERLSSLSTTAGEGVSNKRKFFFEIWAQLIVHGRSEPDATLWLNDKAIKLNPDGTFSCAYSLPDGEIPFKFIAQSSDGKDERHITTHVERKKTISFSKTLPEKPHG